MDATIVISSTLREAVSYIINSSKVKEQELLTLNNTKDTGHLALLFDSYGMGCSRYDTLSFECKEKYSITCFFCLDLFNALANTNNCTCISHLASYIKTVDISQYNNLLHVISIAKRIDYLINDALMDQTIFHMIHPHPLLDRAIVVCKDLFNYLEPSVPWDLIITL